MPNLLRISVFVFTIFSSVIAVAQTPNRFAGVWRGVMKDSLSSFEYTLRITKIENGEVSGTGLSGNQTLYCETNIKGTIKNGRLVIRETDIIRTNYRSMDAVCLLEWNLAENQAMLTGSYRPITNEAACLPGAAAFSFETQPNALPNISVTTETPKVAAEPPKQIAPAYQKRELALIKEIIIDADSASIQLFDNGVVDGDHITLTDNSKEIFSNAALSTQPLKYGINNKTTNTHSISFVADNLGSIPPNTGLMVITANRQRWEIYFSSDFSKTSYVKVILKAR